MSGKLTIAIVDIDGHRTLWFARHGTWWITESTEARNGEQVVTTWIRLGHDLQDGRFCIYANARDVIDAIESGVDIQAAWRVWREHG